MQRLAPQVLLIELAMIEPATFRFRAGQYLIVLTGGAKRAYTLASPAGEQARLSLMVKLLPGGPGSELFEHLQAGGEVTFMGPHGFFLLQPAHAGDVVMVATGIGVVPFLPMLQELLARPSEGGTVRLLWGLRSAGDAYPLEPLEALQKAHPQLTVEQHDAGGGSWDQVEQRLVERVAGELFPTLGQPTFYLSGNGTMIRSLTGALTAAGVDRKKQIASEIFYQQAEP